MRKEGIDQVVEVLLFPGSLLCQILSDDLSRAIIWALNSLLWGASLRTALGMAEVQDCPEELEIE
jgi:hypothetical protein